MFLLLNSDTFYGFKVFFTKSRENIKILETVEAWRLEEKLGTNFRHILPILSLNLIAVKFVKGIKNNNNLKSSKKTSIVKSNFSIGFLCASILQYINLKKS